MATLLSNTISVTLGEQFGFLVRILSTPSSINFSLKGYPEFSTLYKNGERLAVQDAEDDVYDALTNPYGYEVIEYGSSPPRYFKTASTNGGDIWDCAIYVDSNGNPTGYINSYGSRFTPSSIDWPTDGASEWIGYWNSSSDSICGIDPNDVDGSISTTNRLHMAPAPAPAQPQPKRYFTINEITPTQIRRIGIHENFESGAEPPPIVTDVYDKPSYHPDYTGTPAYKVTGKGSIEVNLINEDLPYERLYEEVNEAVNANIITLTEVEYTNTDPNFDSISSVSGATWDADPANPRDWTGSLSQWEIEITGLKIGFAYTISWERNGTPMAHQFTADATTYTFLSVTGLDGEANVIDDNWSVVEGV